MTISDWGCSRISHDSWISRKNCQFAHARIGEIVVIFDCISSNLQISATCKVEYVIIGNICQLHIRNHVFYRCLSISGQNNRISDSNILKTIVPNDGLCRLVDGYSYSTIYWSIIVGVGRHETYREFVCTRNECLVALGIPIEVTLYLSFATYEHVGCEGLRISDWLNSWPCRYSRLNRIDRNVFSECCLLIFLILRSNSCDCHLTMLMDFQDVVFCVCDSRVGRCVIYWCLSFC